MKRITKTDTKGQWSKKLVGYLNSDDLAGEAVANALSLNVSITK